MKTFFGLLVAILVVAASPAPAAACKIPFESVFDRFDRAAVVVVAKPSRVPRARDRRHTVDLTVEKIVKGTPATPTRVVLSGGMCEPGGWKRGRRTLVFLDAAGKPVGMLYAAVHEPTAVMIDELAVWSGITEDEARVRYLVETVAAGHALAIHAADAIAEHPARVDALTQTQVETLATAALADDTVRQLLEEAPRLRREIRRQSRP